jgi:hypothetical protein
MPKPGNTTARGYGTDHQALRRQVRRQVDAGEAKCWRCGQRLDPAEPWDLGHDPIDRTKYRGPEHVKCNRSTNHGFRRADYDDSREW